MAPASICFEASLQMRSMPATNPGRAGVTMEDHRDRLRGELALGHVPELLQVVVGEHRVGHLEPLCLCRPLLEKVPSGAEGGHQRHHRLLANGVDRRVGDLREQLFEVVEEGQRPVAEHGERRVIAHRSDSLLTGLAHRLE